MEKNLPPVTNQSEVLSVQEERFMHAYPTYASTECLDGLRATDYARLDAQGHTYLDYTGGGLYGQSQLQQHYELLNTHVFGNPHSGSPTSQAMTELAEQARVFVREFFGASAEEYAIIFTPNASGALKLVGESYPFTEGSQYLLTFDNHNSVNGIREFAQARGTRVTYAPVAPPDLRVDEQMLLSLLDEPASGPRLFAYPAQSNFTGIQHPLEWIELAHQRGWDVLVDGAAFVPTNRLDLGRWHPDFVPLSFYKMFGYPTGVGCLLARRSALARLRRPWFAGGTIIAVTVQGGWHVLSEDETAFEDGTLNYLSLPAVEIGLRHLQSIGLETIHERVRCLCGWLLSELDALYHANGLPLIRIYGPHTPEMRGGTIALNFLDPAGEVVDERVVDLRARQWNISLRTGCFCNPGAGEAAFTLSSDLLQSDRWQNQHLTTFDEYIAALGLPSAGAIRISLGVASNFADVSRFLVFARTFLDNFADKTELAPRLHC